MSSSDFTTVLDKCLERLKAGESISACLERYPEYAEDLESLLETAKSVEALRFTEPPRPEALARGRQRFLTEAARMREQQQVSGRSWLDKVWDFFTIGTAGPVWGRAAIAVVAVLLLFGMVGGVVVQASESSLPGDPLYPVKQVTRQVQLITTLNPEAREEKREQIQAEERDEVQEAAKQGRVFEKNVAGIIIEAQGNSIVLEDGLRIRMMDSTQVQGQLRVGRSAQIHVRSENGRLLAEQVVVQQVLVQAPTQTPTPVPTATPEPTPTPSPTTTPEPTKPPPTKVIPTDTPKPEATDTPFPTATPTQASRVGPHIFEIQGPIDAIGESVWVVAGEEVEVPSTAIIKGEPAVGRIAYVRANRRADGSFVAVEIEVEVAATPTPAKVIFSGVVDDKESETVWFVNGRRVRFDDRTEINGDLKVGAFVDVEGLWESPTTVFARKITVVRACENPVSLEGIIRSIDAEAGVWIFDGFTVSVDSDVPIHGTPAVGAIAQIEACRTGDSSYSAQRIFIVPETPTPEPSSPQSTPTVGTEGAETPSPGVDETRAPTPTVDTSSDSTLTPTVEPSPTVTNSSSDNAAPTATP